MMYIFPTHERDREREREFPFIVGQSTVDRTHGHTADTEMSAERELCVSHEESTACIGAMSLLVVTTCL